MKEILERIDKIEDPRQEWKVKHKLKDIVFIVLLASISNADDWVEIGYFAQYNEDIIRKYVGLENGVPSHDTIQRVMSIIDPKTLNEMQVQWNELLNANEGEKLKRILNIDGKTMRGSSNKNQKAFHVVSAYSKEDGICLGQTVVNEKENEIIAIPELLKTLKIEGTIITIDAMGTQTKIAEQIKKQHGEYVLAVKGNQGTLYQDLIDYFGESSFLEEIKKAGNYSVKVEKSHNAIEKREYYQTSDIQWLEGNEKWKGLKSIGMTKNTIKKDGRESIEMRYYIVSFLPDIELFERSVRGHWSVEVMHWHLDVTFREDHNETLEKTSAINLNIIRKWSLAILKLLEMPKKMSLKKKRYVLSMSIERNIEKIMNL